MELEQTEQQLIEACRKEEQRWRKWSLTFSVTGYALIGVWLLARRGTTMGDYAIMLLVAAFYLIDAGVSERREHSLRKLVLKFAQEK